MNTQYFQIKNFAKTAENHRKNIAKLQDSYKIEYDDVVDNDFWVTVDTLTESRLSLYDKLPKPKQIATIINMFTRQAIQGSLKWHEIPESYDTAFYIAHYCKINESMTEILENILSRRGKTL